MFEDESRIYKSMNKIFFNPSLKPTQMLSHETTSWLGFYARNIDGSASGLQEQTKAQLS